MLETTILERVKWLSTTIDFITDNDNPTIKDHLRVEAIKKLISDNDMRNHDKGTKGHSSETVSSKGKIACT